MLNRIASSPSRVTDHNPRPHSESAPQSTSNRLIRQDPCGLKNEATNIAAGHVPAANVSHTAAPTPSPNCAAKATNAASAHRKKVTRCGCVVPRSVPAIYPIDPSTLTTTAIATKYWGSIWHFYQRSFYRRYAARGTCGTCSDQLGQSPELFVGEHHIGRRGVFFQVVHRRGAWNRQDHR